jgi:hypothetical protein
MAEAVEAGPVTEEKVASAYGAWSKACATLQVRACPNPSSVAPLPPSPPLTHQTSSPSFHPPQALLNDCTIFLPAFDIRKAQKEVDGLLESAEESKTRIAPRKKFAFRSRPGAASITAAPQAGGGGGAASGAAGTSERSSSSAVAPPSSPSAAASGKENNAAGVAAASSSSSSAAASSAASRFDEDEHTIEGLASTTVYLPTGHFTGPASKDLAEAEARIAAAVAAGGAGSVSADLLQARRHAAAGAAGKDIRLLNLTDCTVVILDPLKAMRVDGLTRCTVITGPVAGSVLLHRCTDCRFLFAARQLRIPHLRRLRLLPPRHVTPHHRALPAPALLPVRRRLPGSAEALEKAGLGPRALSRPDLWRCVDDFGWHRMQASPNWAVLPAGERTGPGVLPAAAAELGLRIEYGETGEEGEAAPPAVVVAAAGAAGTAAGAKGAAPAAAAPAVVGDDEL